MVDLIYSSRCEADRSWDPVPEDGGSGVTSVNVEHAGYDTMPVEHLSIGGMSIRLASIGGGIVPSILGELLFGLFFELTGVCLEVG